MSLFIRLQCKRCLADYPLEPGDPLTEFCETCTRILGRRLYESSQTGLNRRYELQRELCAGAPWGNEYKNLGRVFSLPVRKP